MEKLFAALRDKHPGCEVVDVRFLVDSKLADGRRASQIDESFAKAIREARRVDLGTIAF